MTPRQVEQATQAPGELRRIPVLHTTEKVAVITAAKRLLDECNGDVERAVLILEAVADV